MKDWSDSHRKTFARNLPRYRSCSSNGFVTLCPGLLIGEWGRCYFCDWNTSVWSGCEVAAESSLYHLHWLLPNRDRTAHQQKKNPLVIWECLSWQKKASQHFEKEYCWSLWPLSENRTHEELPDIARISLWKSIALHRGNTKLIGFPVPRSTKGGIDNQMCGLALWSRL